MFDEIIVHVGLPKAGSTTIQTVLFNKRAYLREKELTLYPPIALSHTLPVLSAFSENFGNHPSVKMATAKGSATESKQAKLSSEFRTKIEADARSGRYRKLVLSGEGIAMLSEDELKKFQTWLLGLGKSLTIIFVLRDPVWQVISGVQQRLKSGQNLTKLYATVPLPACKAQLIKFKQVFGRDAVHVLFLEDSNPATGGIVAAFCKICGFSDESCQYLASKQEMSNVSLTFEAASLLDELNRVRTPSNANPHDKSKFKHELDFLRNLKGDKFSVPQDVLAKIYEQTREDVAYLKAEYGYDAYDLDISRYEPRQAMNGQFLRSLAAEINVMMHNAAAHDIMVKLIGHLAEGDLDVAQKDLELLRSVGERNPELTKLCVQLQTLSRRLARRGIGKPANAE